jgi:hypothetical protein
MLQNPLHSPDEMRQISDLAHLSEGLVIGAAALIALLQSRGVFVEGKRRYAWPALIVLAGVFLLAYLVVPHHGLEHAKTQWNFVFGDRQQRQHVVISVLIILGGGAEWMAVAGIVRGRSWLFAWPATLFAIGVFFITHPQHGTTEAVVRALLVHRVLGATLITTAVLATVSAARNGSRRLQLSWSVALLLAATLLIIYKEPEGAYHAAPSAQLQLPGE